MPSPAPASFTLQTLFERVLAFAASAETVVLNTPLEDCYDGVDASGIPTAVELNVTGTYSVPIGVTVTVEVRKQDPATSTFAVIPSTVEVRGTQSFVVIPATSHGITAGAECGVFLVQFMATYPPPRARVKYFGGQSFQICADCAVGTTDTSAPKSSVSKKPKSRK
jgi:PKD repeat protein